MRMTSPEARPRTPEECSVLPYNHSILEAVSARGITEVLHFTHTHNLVGILASSLKSRLLVKDDPYVVHVHDPNCTDRSRDLEWVGYVSLSISRINEWMLSCSRRWHRHQDVEWVVLSLDPEILAHPGVVFTTTNNAYPVCLRAERQFGFDRIFAEEVVSHHRTICRTSENLDDRCPTDRWAEVLYPGELSLDHLRKIYVDKEEMVEHVEGILAVVDRNAPVEYQPEVFR